MIVRSVAAMQRVGGRWKRAGVKVALAPTMGYLHAGHLRLVERGRKLVGDKGKVVVSIYVNPTQFGPKEDFAKYPRDLRRDLGLCREAGVDVVFAPDNKQMYRGDATGGYSTYVVEEDLSKLMEGKSRPTHFRGVTTVVAKLFNIVQPQVAVFGTKDYQQTAVIKRMVRDLNFSVKIEVAPTLREVDGVAMSSRNKFLEGDLRRQAAVLSRAIREARKRVSRSRQRAEVLKRQLKILIEKEPEARVDYIEFFEPKSLTPVSSVSNGSQIGLAVFIGNTRLIDNGRL